MSEILSKRGLGLVTSLAIGALVLEGCSFTVDSYLTDPSNVKCDGKRTKTDLNGDGMASFVVHGKHTGELAIVKVRRAYDKASLSVVNDTANSPAQQYDKDGFSTPTSVVDGSELSVIAGGGAWVIDVRKDSVIIQGSCDGL